MTFFYRRTRASGTGPARPAPRAQAALTDALQALGGPFIVADLETTGLSTSSCEILEFAAVRVGVGGVLEREYTQVVRTCGPVPSFISRLTGITQAEVERDGVPVVQAFSSFLDFVEDLPVFFHNASFDRRFLGAAADQTGLPFPNATHCTLALARRAWPELPSHKLDILARHVGASQPTHRALADVRTTVAVALAASARLAAS
ncbi:3'-5' exonuclease [Achromobacter spanius]|uniref:3'-5' exonuclease n=1 Tax=Achromobacter spanius TaxID=217203 RepID=UPI00320AD49F